MAETTYPLLTYICSISPQKIDAKGNAITFSIHGGNVGGFSKNVLKHMPISQIAGKYLMVFDPDKNTLTIRRPE